MVLAPKWKFETGNTKLVVGSIGASLKHQIGLKNYHKDASNKFILWGTHVENCPHIVSGCSILAQKEYKRKQDKV